ncbi:MAG: TetM/TetW/TetO/TetS family tetracycline resistance ribosomal protection protein [Lachnospiraceae bacterium]|nr:TetM/TetW/TetO/TetS family tetracycline resistance ribosomal protection protein [Lachnospiraceae bacterium]
MAQEHINNRIGSYNIPAKRLVMGILAHVDAGKTTLAESILYLTGNIRSLGRVDHGNTFLDTNEMERARGITIFSKQAEVILKAGNVELPVTFMDTPGHVDFSAEMERTLQILDYAVLVINGMDGIQGHVLTLWKLLKRYNIPTFLFVNKMDQGGTDREKLLSELQERLSGHCVPFDVPQDEEWKETLAMCTESLMEQYLETGELAVEDIRTAITERHIFPCFFGSALKIQGVEELLQGFITWTVRKQYPAVFGARVYKITRDEKGNRLTHVKLTGGSLKVKEVIGEEKADQIRFYSGVQFRTEPEAFAGEVCAITGLESTYAGQGLGMEESLEQPVLAPVLTYQLLLPTGAEPHVVYRKLMQIEEEEPLLHLVWEEQTKEIRAQVMGEVQIEVLKNMIKERLGLEVSFGTGCIVYKETIAEAVEEVGHFEPLRHYAEAHILLEPGERGSGLTFASDVSTDSLDLNWQRLILTHLEEKQHKGVLTGAPITDMKLTVIGGRSHKKHTEGGDFREATYRAVRQGLKKAKSILLEPVYEFRLELPLECVGRAMTDIGKMQGKFTDPEMCGTLAVITGTAPVATMQEYPMEVAAYTKGEGRILLSPGGYEPCHNEEEVIASIGYDSEADLANPTGSVFCAHGAGFVVPWDEVENYMHVETEWEEEYADSIMGSDEQKQSENAGKGAGQAADGVLVSQSAARKSSGSSAVGAFSAEDKELAEIFNRTYGKSEMKGKTGSAYDPMSVVHRPSTPRKVEIKPVERQEEYLLVDGYNIIFSWDELNEMSKTNIAAARQKLMDVLCNYQGFKKCTLILVFDAYKVEGFQGEVQKYHNIHVVYTKEAETADQYIEKTVHQIAKKYKVTVATSDATEQVIIWGAGAMRMSAQGLLEEVQETNKEIHRLLNEVKKPGKESMLKGLAPEVAELLEEVRLGKRTL